MNKDFIPYVEALALKNQDLMSLVLVFIVLIINTIKMDIFI